VEVPSLQVGVVVDPKSTLGSSARSGYGILTAYVCLHTTMVYVPHAQPQTKTMIEGLDSCGLPASPMDLLAASQTLANPKKTFQYVA
jgi:hypothetical protein